LKDFDEAVRIGEGRHGRFWARQVRRSFWTKSKAWFVPGLRFFS
jgi:hypothetical protein